RCRDCADRSAARSLFCPEHGAASVSLRLARRSLAFTRRRSQEFFHPRQPWRAARPLLSPRRNFSLRGAPIAHARWRSALRPFLRRGGQMTVNELRPATAPTAQLLPEKHPRCALSTLASANRGNRVEMVS